MTDTTARIKKAGKNFEILVDLNEALSFKRGNGSSTGAENDKVFKDIKKGMVASQEDLKEAFGTTDSILIIERIVKEGEILTTQEYRDEEREKKMKQVVDILSRNAIDPKTGIPHSSEKIKNALEQANVNLKNVPIENQISDILAEITKILPIAIKTKKIMVTIPAIHTGKAYGIINQYKEKEDWLGDGSLKAVLSVPAGMIMDFYDKLNTVTHGSALTEEIKNNG